MTDRKQLQTSFTFKLPKKDLELFQFVASKNDRSASQILRAAIKQYIASSKVSQIDIED